MVMGDDNNRLGCIFIQNYCIFSEFTFIRSEWGGTVISFLNHYQSDCAAIVGFSVLCVMVPRAPDWEYVNIMCFS